MNDLEVAKRFDRLENKIDRLTDVMATMARVEEQIIGQNARLKRHEWRLDEHEKKIDEVVETVATNSMIVKVGQGIVASVWAAFLGFVLYIFKE